MVLAGTWNVNETRCSEHSISRWLVPRAAKADIVAVALQVRGLIVWVNRVG